MGWPLLRSLPRAARENPRWAWCTRHFGHVEVRSEEHTSELQSQFQLVCRLLLEKKKDAIRYGVVAHPPIPFWIQGLKLWIESSFLVEQFLWLVVAHPLLPYLQFFFFDRDLPHRDLIPFPTRRSSD